MLRNETGFIFLPKPVNRSSYIIKMV